MAAVDGVGALLKDKLQFRCIDRWVFRDPNDFKKPQRNGGGENKSQLSDHLGRGQKHKTISFLRLPMRVNKTQN